MSGSQSSSQSWQQSPLVTLSEPWNAIVEERSHIPALAMKGTNSQTCWICACKIKVENSSSIFALSPFRHSEAAKDWWLVQFPQCFPHSTGISSSWRKPPLFWEQETFSWGHCRYSALTKTNCYLNTQTPTGKSLPVFKHNIQEVHHPPMSPMRSL